VSTPARIALAGSSGSIGTQAIDVVRAEPDRWRISALGVGTSVDTVVAQAHEVRPEVVVVADRAKAEGVAERLPRGTELRVGPDAMASLVDAADVVVNGVVGFAGLPVTLATLEAGKRLALANKESLIAAGPVVQAVRATPGAELVPVDSEHCALHQCLRASVDPAAEVSRLVLTASGGPFRGRTRAELAGVGIEQALAHPTWSMGPKITVDSSTLMNKGLEVIEAHELFGVPYDRVEVVVHPQSVVHSMVEFADGATVAQLSLPDMRLCIAYALAHPRRGSVAWGRIDWTALRRLDFEPPDLDAFRCLGLAYDAGRVGGTAPAWLNAANEVAVAAFLAGELPWVGIAEVLEEALQRHDGAPAATVDDVVEADRKGRAAATAAIAGRMHR
jgi:1-deoxy-D-xylulose-5-phosphate reductoisomerase